MKEKVKRLKEKERFVDKVVQGDLEIMNVKKERVVYRMREMGFGRGENGAKMEKESISSNGEFDYLLSIPVKEFTREGVDKLRKNKSEEEMKMTTLQGKSATDLWENDLNHLYSALEKDFR